MSSAIFDRAPVLAEFLVLQDMLKLLTLANSQSKISVETATILLQQYSV